MLGNAELIAFAATSGAAAAKAFYADILGLRLIADEQSAIVFDANGTQLRIQKVASTSPSAFTVLGWEVESIEHVVRDLRDRGVVFEEVGFLEQDALGIWTAGDGTRVAWFKDPDGNTLSVTEFPKL